MPDWGSSGWESSEAWSLACEAPCDKLLPLGHAYRLSGPGVRRSRRFHLEASPGQRVAITARAASTDAFNGGIAIIVLGALAIPGGLLVTLVGDLRSLPSTKGTPDVGLERAGEIMAVFGGLAVVGGIVLAYANASSHQSQEILRPEPSEHPDTVWLRTPAWRDSVRDRPPSAPIVGIPILSRFF